MTTGMDEWADGSPGRLMTWPASDGYVLVDGVQRATALPRKLERRLDGLRHTVQPGRLGPRWTHRVHRHEEPVGRGLLRFVDRCLRE